MIKKLFKLIFINALFLAGLIILLNLALITVSESYRLIRDIAFNSDSRAKLPNYENLDWAEKHFQEFGDLKSTYQSYVGWRRLKYSGQTITIDEKGIRQTPQSPLVKEDSPLVAFLGGSTIWGTGSDDKNTIPALFSDISNGQFRTINLGETSYRAFQEYIFLLIQIQDGLKPDIIISYDGVNLLGGLRPQLNAKSHAREQQIRSSMKNRDKKDILTFSDFFISPIDLFISRVKTNFNRNFNLLDDAFYELTPLRIEQVARTLLDSWLLTSYLAERNGALYICSLQPNISVGTPNLKHLDIDRNFEVNGIARSYYLLYSKILELIKDPKYKRLTKHFLNLSNAFDGDEYIYIDTCHVSPNGNKLISKLLYDYVSKIK